MMKRTIGACASLAILAGTIAVAQQSGQPAKKPETRPVAPAQATQPATQPAGTPGGEHKMQLPPGFSEADMQACMLAGTPGAEHQKMLECVGTWTGTTKMWMAPGTEPVTTQTTSTLSPFMDGRYLKMEMQCDLPGMGPMTGFGLYAYDNVAKAYQAIWVDNHSTGVMTGTGEKASDGTMTWTYSYNCPITKKPAKMREVQRKTGPDAMTMEMYGTDPKSGKEFKMMEMQATRTTGAKTSASR